MPHPNWPFFIFPPQLSDQQLRDLLLMLRSLIDFIEQHYGEQLQHSDPRQTSLDLWDDELPF